jgi:hypothetical protein
MCAICLLRRSCQCLRSWRLGRKEGPFSYYLDTRVFLLAPLSSNFNLIFFFLFARGGYVEGNESVTNGNDLVREAGGGVVAVFIQYRLGVFGFLPGEKVKEGGALNAGLCKYP